MAETNANTVNPVPNQNNEHVTHPQKEEDVNNDESMHYEEDEEEELLDAKVIVQEAASFRTFNSNFVNLAPSSSNGASNSLPCSKIGGARDGDVFPSQTTSRLYAQGNGDSSPTLKLSWMTLPSNKPNQVISKNIPEIELKKLDSLEPQDIREFFLRMEVAHADLVRILVRHEAQSETNGFDKTKVPGFQPGMNDHWPIPCVDNLMETYSAERLVTTEIAKQLSCTHFSSVPLGNIPNGLIMKKLHEISGKAEVSTTVYEKLNKLKFNKPSKSGESLVTICYNYIMAFNKVIEQYGANSNYTIDESQVVRIFLCGLHPTIRLIFVEELHYRIQKDATVMIFELPSGSAVAEERAVKISLNSFNVVKSAFIQFCESVQQDLINHLLPNLWILDSNVIPHYRIPKIQKNGFSQEWLYLMGFDNFEYLRNRKRDSNHGGGKDSGRSNYGSGKGSDRSGGFKRKGSGYHELPPPPKKPKLDNSKENLPPPSTPPTIPHKEKANINNVNTEVKGKAPNPNTVCPLCSEKGHNAKKCTTKDCICGTKPSTNHNPYNCEKFKEKFPDLAKFSKNSKK